MKRAGILLVVLMSLFSWVAVLAQDEQEEEKKFEWTPDLEWEPPADLLVGIERIGELSTLRKSLMIRYPETIKVVGDDLYLFDVEIEKLLLFDAAGNFRRSLFSEDQKITGHVRWMNIDDKGRVLFNDYSTFYLFADGEITSYKNYQRVSAIAWNGDTIYGLNLQAAEREEGLIKEVTLEGEVLRTWGEPFWKDKFDRPSGFSSLILFQDKLYLSSSHIDGFFVYDPQSESTELVDFSIPAFRRRIQRTRESLEYSEKTKARRIKVFSVFMDANIFNGEAYLLLSDRYFYSIVVSNLQGEIKRVYRGLKPKDAWAWAFAVSEVEGEPRFFLVTGERKGDEYVREVGIFAPCETVPTLADLEKTEEQGGEEETADKDLEEARKAVEAFQEAYKLAQKASSEEEKRRIYYKLAADYPGHQMSAFSLRYAAGNKPNPQIAEEVLQHVDAALPNVDDEEVRNEYLLLRVSLCGSAAKAEEVRTTAGELFKSELRPNGYMTIDAAAAKVGDWELLLRSAVYALAVTDGENILSMYGGMSQEQVEMYQRYFKSAFLTDKGRALTNLDRPREALAHFEAAVEVTGRHYTGNFAGDLDLHWAMALHKSGEHAEALETLTPGALFGGGEEKIKALEEIYAATGGQEDFEAFLWSHRLQRARTLDDAVFYDYDKKPVKISSKLGKATILTFWTPSS